ncbi:MAG: tyrosine-type recombinase/integrase [Actinomycetales bacterium]|nr:tyrosine-type recombinase/integrase [Actinomycetales bacterium]
MASLEKRTRKDGSTAFRVVWRENGQKQSETFGPGRQLQAKAFLRDVEASGERWPVGWVKGVGYPPPDEGLSGYTVRSAAIRAIDVNQRATEGSKADYRREVDRYLPEDDPLAEMAVEKVTVDAIHDWHIRLQKRGANSGGPRASQVVSEERTLSAKTRRHAQSRLSSGLNLMVKLGHIPRNPAVGLGPGRSKRKRIQALSVDDFKALLTYIPEYYVPLVQTLGRTGMRFSEATALTARRVELDREPPLINVEEAWKRTEQYGRYERGGPKSLEGNRIIPIDPELAALLRPLVDGKKGNAEVFVTTYDTVVHYNNFHSRVWRPAVVQAFADDAIPFEATIHDLRHAHASWLLAEGVPVLTVADRLGHDPAVLLKVYAHLMDAARNEPALAIARLLGD